MKSQKYKLLILLALAFSSCDNSLDLNPLDQISSSTFWKTKSDFDKCPVVVAHQFKNNFANFLFLLHFSRDNFHFSLL